MPGSVQETFPALSWYWSGNHFPVLWVKFLSIRCGRRLPSYFTYELLSCRHSIRSRSHCCSCRVRSLLHLTPMQLPHSLRARTPSIHTGVPCTARTGCVYFMHCGTRQTTRQPTGIPTALWYPDVCCNSCDSPVGLARGSPGSWSSFSSR
jgi:hypothetical protein